MVLGNVVPLVCWFSWTVNPELFLALSASQPMESHIHDFGAAWLDRVVDDPQGRGVVGLDRGWWLRVTHFLELMAGGDSFATVDVESAKFCFQG